MTGSLAHLGSAACHKEGEHQTPNTSFERTHSGSPRLAFISFSAKPVLPPRASQLKR